MGSLALGGVRNVPHPWTSEGNVQCWLGMDFDSGKTISFFVRSGAGYGKVDCRV